MGTFGAFVVVFTVFTIISTGSVSSITSASVGTVRVGAGGVAGALVLAFAFVVVSTFESICIFECIAVTGVTGTFVTAFYVSTGGVRVTTMCSSCALVNVITSDSIAFVAIVASASVAAEGISTCGVGVALVVATTLINIETFLKTITRETG